MLEFDEKAETLWVNNRGARILLGRALAAQTYDYLLGVIPAPYFTEAGRIGGGRKFNKRALALATALVNCVYLGTYARLGPISEDQVRETHKSRFLS